MSTANSSNAITVGLIAVPEVSAAVLYSFHELFASVGTAWEAVTGECRPARLMQPKIVAASRKPFETTLGVPVVPNSTFEEASGTAIVIVPDLAIGQDGSVAPSCPDAEAWLQQEYDNGAVVCSVCTGSLMLAAAGLLAGLDATTHWSVCGIFRDKFSNVQLRPERILVPAGPEHRIVTSGGSASWTELALYLVARFSGAEEARRIAKLFLLGDRTDGQLPFAMLARPRQHSDRQVADSQAWIARNYDASSPVESMARRSGLAERTFARRFRRATGFTPIGYVQTLRIEEAKQILETTSMPVDSIANEVGYQDEAAFRRLFKRQTGITPMRYRQKFKLTDWPTPDRHRA